MAVAERKNPMTGSKLTPKQSAFVAEYVKNGGNGTKAALKSYDTKDYMTAHAIATENLQKPSIAEQIEQACIRINLTPERVITNLVRVMEQKKHLSVVVSSAQVINDMTGWRAPVKVDNTHRLEAPEEAMLLSFR